jgi:hypothetical protein
MSATFEAAENVIRVRDASGAVVFDTATPMPHIAAAISASLSHSFAPSATARVIARQWRTINTCQEYRNICTNDYICRQVYECWNDYVCDWSFGQYTCGWKQVCGWRQVCGWEQVCSWQWVNVDGYQTDERASVAAREHTQTYTLGTLPSGTNPDFLLVLITATRTRAGAQGDYGTFVSAIPANETICATGSTLLETAFQPDGAPWLSRIVSVYLEGDSVRAEFRHSNRPYTGAQIHAQHACFGYPSGFAPLDDTRSDWTFSFDIHAGKFTT